MVSRQELSLDISPAPDLPGINDSHPISFIERSMGWHLSVSGPMPEQPLEEGVQARTIILSTAGSLEARDVYHDGATHWIVTRPASEAYCDGLCLIWEHDGERYYGRVEYERGGEWGYCCFRLTVGWGGVLQYITCLWCPLIWCKTGVTSMRIALGPATGEGWAKFNQSFLVSVAVLLGSDGKESYHGTLPSSDTTTLEVSSWEEDEEVEVGCVGRLFAMLRSIFQRD